MAQRRDRDALIHGPFAFYAKLLGDAYYAGILAETLKVGVIATLASLVVGYPVAYFMVRYAGRWNGLIVFLLIAPLLTSIIMRTFGWRVLLARKGPVTLLLHDWGLIARPTNLADDPIAVYVALVHVLVPFHGAVHRGCAAAGRRAAGGILAGARRRAARDVLPHHPAAEPRRGWRPAASWSSSSPTAASSPCCCSAAARSRPCRC